MVLCIFLTAWVHRQYKQIDEWIMKDDDWLRDNDEERLDAQSIDAKATYCKTTEHFLESPFKRRNIYKKYYLSSEYIKVTKKI